VYQLQSTRHVGMLSFLILGRVFTVLNYDDEGRPTEQMNLNDPACILNHTGPGPTEYIERLYYYTELEQGKIVLTTSCDGKLFTMTGAVNQVITYLHNPIDIETIFLEEDYNFDGYADFEAVRIADGGGGDYPQYDVSRRCISL
jgi:hypothetical protein